MLKRFIGTPKPVSTRPAPTLEERKLMQPHSAQQTIIKYKLLPGKDAVYQLPPGPSQKETSGASDTQALVVEDQVEMVVKAELEMKGLTTMGTKPDEAVSSESPPVSATTAYLAHSTAGVDDGESPWAKDPENGFFEEDEAKEVPATSFSFGTRWAQTEQTVLTLNRAGVFDVSIVGTVDMAIDITQVCYNQYWLGYVPVSANFQPECAPPPECKLELDQTPPLISHEALVPHTIKQNTVAVRQSLTRWGWGVKDIKHALENTPFIMREEGEKKRVAEKPRRVQATTENPIDTHLLTTEQKNTALEERRQKALAAHNKWQRKSSKLGQLDVEKYPIAVQSLFAAKAKFDRKYSKLCEMKKAQDAEVARTSSGGNDPGLPKVI